MKKIIIILIVAIAALCFSGCSALDGAAKVADVVHEGGKLGYRVGGKKLLSQESQERLQSASEMLDEYGEGRKEIRAMQNEYFDDNQFEQEDRVKTLREEELGKKLNVSTSEVSEE